MRKLFDYGWMAVLVCVIALLFIACDMAYPQIPSPQINLTGNIGCQGFPCLNTGTLNLAVDGNHTMTAQETSAFSFKVTSSVSLTATRNLVMPTGKFPLGCIENSTSGGQIIQIIGPSGTGVSIPNGASVCGMWNDGTNYVTGSVAGGSVTSVSATGTQGVTVSVGTPTTTPAIAVGLGAITPTSVTLSSLTNGDVVAAGSGGMLTNGPAINTLCLSSGTNCPGGITVPSTTNILSGNGTGGVSNSGIASANVPLLNASNTFTGSTNSFISINANSLSGNNVGSGTFFSSSSVSSILATGNASSSSNFNSFPFSILANCWNGSSNTSDSFVWTVVEGAGTNPSSTLTLSPGSTNCSGVHSISVPFASTFSNLLSTGGVTASGQVNSSVGVSGGSIGTSGGVFGILQLIDSSAGTDMKIADFIQSGSTFMGRFDNDAQSAAPAWLTVNRSGNTATGISFSAPVSASLKTTNLQFGTNTAITSTSGTLSGQIVNGSGSYTNGNLASWQGSGSNFNVGDSGIAASSVSTVFLNSATPTVTSRIGTGSGTTTGSTLVAVTFSTFTVGIQCVVASENPTAAPLNFTVTQPNLLHITSSLGTNAPYSYICIGQ